MAIPLGGQALTGADLETSEPDPVPSVGKVAKDNSGPGRWSGIYSDWPAAMPKHHPGNHLTSTRTSQARMWLPFADEAAYKVYKGRLSERSQNYVNALSTFIDGARGIGFVDFFLQSVNESYQEKVQISEVLSDGYIAHFFGQRAPMWGYSGVVLNTRQDEWYDIWHILYEDVLRGTRLADAKLPVRLAYDTRIVSGSLVNMSTTLNAPNETFATLQFQLLVKEVKYSPSASSRATELSATGAGSTVFESADVLVTTMYSGLSAARQDFRDEEKANADVRPGGNPQELKEKTGIDTQTAVEQTSQDQSVSQEPLNYTPANGPPVEGTGVEEPKPFLPGSGALSG